MRGRVRRRRDGIVEIRRPSWRDAVATSDVAVVAALGCAWAVCTALVVIGIVEVPFFVGAAGTLAGLVVTAVSIGRAVAGAEPERDTDPSPPPGWAA